MRKLTLAAMCLTLFAISALTTNAQQTFTSAPITIPALGPATPYPAPIVVSGVTGNVTDINVRINSFDHTFPDDVDILLVSPSGASFIVQSDVAGTVDAVDLTYTLDDQAAALLPDAAAIPTGSSRPTNYGTGDTFAAPAPAGPYGSPAPAGTATLNGTFGGAAANGTWNVYVVDDLGGDMGDISGGVSLIFSGGTPAVEDAVLDFDGDGRTDYTVVRNGAAGSTATWFILQGASAAGVGGTSRAQPFGLTVTVAGFGGTADRPVPADYDGDDKDDIAVYRPGTTESFFYILRSSNSTFEARQFGRTGDDQRIVDDYDGDDIDDVAVYRPGSTTAVVNPGCGSTLPNPSAWYFRPSATPSVNFRYVCFGASTDFAVPGDFDGDARADFMVQRLPTAPATQATFFLLRSTGQQEAFVFGNGSEFVIPGDYDGDGRTDVALERTISGNRNFFIRQSSNGATRQEIFGLAADATVQGDYNGDGRTDIAVFRPNADPAQNFFFVRTSPNAMGAGSVDFAVEWGQQGDQAVANYNRR